MVCLARTAVPSRRRWVRVAPMAVAMVVAACGSLPTPHENFKAIIGGAVGRNIKGERQSSKVISATILPNGRKELGFQYRGTCRYFYEVDAEGTIVAWRFEGKENDCVIYP